MSNLNFLDAIKNIGESVYDNAKVYGIRLTAKFNEVVRKVIPTGLLLGSGQALANEGQEVAGISFAAMGVGYFLINQFQTSTKQSHMEEENSENETSGDFEKPDYEKSSESRKRIEGFMTGTQASKHNYD